MPADDSNAPASIRVLVVEDEAITRLSISEFLRDEGFDVLEASRPSEAMTLMWDPDDVDAVFTDVQMPGPIDGLELAGWLHTEHPDVAVLVTSGAVQSQHIDNNPAAEAIMSKPYNKDDVASQIKVLVKEKRQPGLREDLPVSTS